MKEKILIIMLISIFSLGFFAANAHAKEPISKTLKSYEVSKLLWSDVGNPEGVYLGRVTNFVVDSNGRMEFAILLEGYLEIGDSRYVAVPYNMLSLSPGAHFFVLNATRQRLASAPTFNEKEDLSNRRFAESVYKYFGLQPYWTEGGYAKGMDPYRWGGEAQGF
jgi:sporulation protein YlmC with PRC-barrel domain